ncbi:trypsin-like serine protease [Streptomyces sp. MMS21 TC-5]|uniref:trypsin-like serine peptidase n=1 Tax=Streptomyces sp. MMS21 TC-5 TaxID=2925833 RepID=UPI001F615B54|nr:trypsin-like serine protease [Streptomyces sp. MMS21 TC-5]MCI4079547.1 trypsin-like serine protease [Streptomyces sp. MMS21 TC-5]
MPIAAFAAPSPQVSANATAAPESGIDLDSVLAAAGIPSPTGEPSKTPSPIRPPESKVGSAAAGEKFWTPDRIAKAKPVDEQTARVAKQNTQGSERDATAPVAASVSEKRDQVGLFFFVSGDGYKFCAGTVVPAQGKNVVATAAHCFDGATPIHHVVFVPGHGEKTPRPFGVFPVATSKIHMVPAYKAPGGFHTATDVDLAFALAAPRADGKNVEDVVGSIPLAFSSGFNHPHTKVRGQEPNTAPTECDAPMKQSTTETAGEWVGGVFTQVDCAASTPGTSGGPFLIDVDGRPALAGVVGGWKTGGDEPGTVYGSYLDDDAKALYQAATTQNDPPSTSTPSASATPGPSATPAPPTPSRPAPVSSLAAEMEAFWTPERMQLARPDARQAAREALLSPKARALATSPSKEFEGIKEVGTFFYATDDGYRFCAGTVVPSPGKNIVATAAHCFDPDDKATKLVFVPKHNATTPRPYGMFPIAVGQIYMDAAYAAPNGEKAATDLDFAFLKTEPRSDGKNLEDVVGSIPLALNQGFDHPGTQVIGYPYLPDSDKYKPKQNPLTCTTPTKKFTTGNSDGWKGGTFLQVDCKGYVSGTSGGPFLIKMGSGLGLAGVTGGWKTGGHSPDTSYSSYFGDDVKRVYDAAVAGKQPDPRPGSALSPGETWRDYARGIASGYFTGGGNNSRERMDMLVWWKDGEVSLYRGANPEKGYFDRETRVQAPNDTWRDYAVEITAGDFTGDSRSDLVVRWKDGEVSLYPSVDENGFHGEIQILAPNDDWKNYARQMTTGRFSGNARQDHIVIRWKDGEVSQFTDVSERGMGTETQAIAPNDTWVHADEIASGDYTGTDNWDLIIRWSDGELTNYQDFTGNVGASKENQLVAANDTWDHATILSGGDYSDNPWPDDTVVRWTDGEMTLYTDGNGTTIGAEHKIVSAAL